MRRRRPVISVSQPESGFPAGALAIYDFSRPDGDAVINIAPDGTLPDLFFYAGVDGMSNPRPLDYSRSGGRMLFNLTIGSFTFAFPFSYNNGTAAFAPTFANTFGAGRGGTWAVRVKPHPDLVADLGSGNQQGIVTWRPSPDVNLQSFPPRALVFIQFDDDGPLRLRVKEGANVLDGGHADNEYLTSRELTSDELTNGFTAIMTFGNPLPSTAKIYIDGVLAGEIDRVTEDNAATAYTIQFALQSSLDHGADRSYYNGSFWKASIYDREFNATEVLSLHAAMVA